MTLIRFAIALILFIGGSVITRQGYGQSMGFKSIGSSFFFFPVNRLKIRAYYTTCSLVVIGGGLLGGVQQLQNALGALQTPVLFWDKMLLPILLLF